MKASAHFVGSKLKESATLRKEDERCARVYLAVVFGSADREKRRDDMMQDQVAVAAAVPSSQPARSESAPPTSVGRTLSALSTLSISEFASAAKSEPQPQQQTKKKSAAAKKRKANKAKSADGSGAIVASGGAAVSGTSMSSTGSPSNQATPKRKAATTKSKNNDNNSKAKTTSNNSNNAKEENGPPAFVPAHMPVWLPDIAHVNDSSAPITERLGHEMTSYCTYTSEIVASLQKSINEAIAHISTCVQTIWPEATVTCFDVKTRFVLGIKELQQIASRLRKQKWVQRIDVVGSAKVPVAKLVLAENDLRVDISIENLHTRHGIEASDMVREYVTAMPILHSLIVVVKQLLREKGLNNAFTGGLSSYAVALMALYLIERQGMTEESGPEALGQLLMEFLEFYGMTFSYATTGISLKPEAFGEYFLAPHLLLSNGVALMPQLVLDDPVYLDGQHNAAAGAFGIARVIAAFENSYYAISFHRPSKFTPTPLCQLLHWSGHTSPPTAG